MVITTQVLKHLPGERKDERGESQGGVRGGATEEQWRRVCMSESILGYVPPQSLTLLGNIALGQLPPNI